MFIIPLASSGLRPQDIRRVTDVLESGRLTMGEEVKKFESLMSNYLGVKHFIMVNSGSSANLLIIEALMRPTSGQPSLHPGDSILVPAIAWPTTIWPLIQLGLNPIFVDIDEETLAIDLVQVRNLLEARLIPIRGLLPIHPLGLTLSNRELSDLAQDHDLVLINDVCESLGSRDSKGHAGTSGVAASFSFYFSHHMTTMEGGGVATNSDAMADDLRSMRSHGWSRDRSDAAAWQNGRSDADSKFLFVSTGFNVRPMEIQAAIGILQLEALDSFVARRKMIVSRVYSRVAETSLEIVGYRRWLENPTEHSWMLLPLRIKGFKAHEKRSAMMQLLHDRGIETRPVLTGNFLAQPAIQRISKQQIPPSSFPCAEAIAKESFMVSCHHDLTDEQIEYLASNLYSVSKEVDQLIK